MEEIFDFIESNPIWGIVIVLVLICFVVSRVSKAKKNQSTGTGTTSSTAASTGHAEIGDVDKVETESGYYRYQGDKQHVIKRTEEQQKIFEEYFVVRNIKTTTCNSSLKKIAKTMKLVSRVLFWLGVLLGGIGVLKKLPAMIVIGALAVIAAIVCRGESSSFMSRFEASIKSTTAPKKLMTDDEFEALVNAKIESLNIGQLGLERLGLDVDQVREIRPIVLRDKVIDETSLIVQEGYSLHSSTQYVTYLYFTDEQLFVYKIQFDMCCSMQDEWTSEFFYQDICDVSSHTSRNILKGENFEFEYSTVAFNIIASNSSIGFDMAGDNEKIGSIQAMKQKIREKKAQ